MNVKSSAKLASVQYLRAIAALGVVAFHTGNMGNFRPGFEFLRLGEHGVDLFFVISGFIITLTSRKTSAAFFLSKRLVRIVPLYWLVTLGYLLIDAVAPDLLRSGTTSLAHVVSSFLFLPGYHPGHPDQIWPLVVPGWSLNYELFFYLVFTVALLFTQRYRSILTIGFFALLIVLGLIFPVSNAIVLTYTSALLAEFAFGILVAEIFLAAGSHALAIAVVLFSTIGSLVILFSLFGLATSQPLLYGSISAAILSFLLWLERQDVKFGNRVAIALGDASYSIYLTHFAVIAGLRTIGDRIIEEPGPGVRIATLCTALFISSVVGWLVYVILERPITVQLTARVKSVFLPQPTALLMPSSD